MHNTEYNIEAAVILEANKPFQLHYQRLLTNSGVAIRCAGCAKHKSPWRSEAHQRS